MDSYIKHLLGFDSAVSESKVRAEWQRRTKSVYKPCWELKYCPYGPLVEEFPLLSPTRSEAIEHNEFPKRQLAANAYGPELRDEFQRKVREFDQSQYPVAHKKSDKKKSCTVFGHMCSVFFVKEPLTETQELRRLGRHIPRPVMLRVVRRHNNQSQSCGSVLKDDEIEFDHVIPVSKGG